MPRHCNFKRLVLGLHEKAPDPIIRLASELAGRLDLDLFGFFIEDRNLLGLAGLPFAREFRPFGGEWHPLDAEKVLRDIELAAKNAERVFNEAVRGLQTASRFEIVRGSAAETMSAIARAGDIVAIFEPASPAERVIHQFAYLQEAARRSAAALLVIPAQVARVSGAVVAIATTPHDPSISAAYDLAQALEEELTIVETFRESRPRQAGNEIASVVREVKHVSATSRSFADASAVATAFAGLKERLVVISRGAFDDDVASLIASTRRVPVLVIEIERADALRQDEAAASDRAMG